MPLNKETKPNLTCLLLWRKLLKQVPLWTASHHSRAPAGHSLAVTLVFDCDCETDWLRDLTVYIYIICINNFITPTNDSGCQPTWAASTCLHKWTHPVFKNPRLTALSKVSMQHEVNFWYQTKGHSFKRRFSMKAEFLQLKLTKNRSDFVIKW